jgi:hypothetical protein
MFNRKTEEGIFLMLFGYIQAENRVFRTEANRRMAEQTPEWSISDMENTTDAKELLQAFKDIHHKFK